MKDDLGMEAKDFSNMLIGMITNWRDSLPSVEDFTAEPAEPLIVESGGSPEKPGYVAFFKGINYLCTDKNIIKLGKTWTDEGMEKLIKDSFKSFTGENPDITELTPEISKLWPMVYSKLNKGIRQLVWYDDGELITVGGWNEGNDFRLATAKELQEHQK